jgi:hypothetical protein
VRDYIIVALQVPAAIAATAVTDAIPPYGHQSVTSRILRSG